MSRVAKPALGKGAKPALGKGAKLALGKGAKLALGKGAKLGAGIGAKAVYFLNGPNANLYGLTDQGTYGSDTYAMLQSRCEAAAKRLSIRLSFRQSNSEGQLVDWVQEAIGKADGLIVNGAGLTYTSIALLDALLAFPGPVVEVHMSNIYRRESFRHHSFISKAATGIVAGLGADGYELAIAAMRRLLDRPPGN